ncbi:MAG TPA: 1-acyl-sn-glycerol-3-phosphate acyltransferase [Anaerolineae bacterium]|nr:1-acyl-sn-glycerol-3-phosphate acyltransferase [Anaerolineae bacterium]
MTTPVEALTRINLAEMLDNFGLDNLRVGRNMVERLCRAPAQILAEQAVSFDQHVGAVGLQLAARQWLSRCVNRVDVVGASHLPATGGVILAANHPGMTDTLAVLSSVPRSDLRLVSADRPFVRALGHVAQRTFFVSDRSHERMTVVRQIARYIQQGGAVLICPAGKIEPDPAVMSGGVESLQTWSDSLGLFVRLAPQAVVVPTMVSGVVYAPALRHPLTRLRCSAQNRERIAATLQAYWQSAGRITRHINVRVEFGQPLPAAELNPPGTSRSASAVTQEITNAARYLLERLASENTSQLPERAYRLMDTI